ncbi:MAG: VOC family protein [Renibacterium sp.]|nr:VOC family protein [Renibacterium sp.]
MNLAGLHHVEIWVQDFAAAERSLGWLLGRLGFARRDSWGADPIGASWQIGDFYLVLEAGPAVSAGHDRMRAGLNHLAFTVPDAETVESILAESSQHGWTLMFAEQHPYAGGAAHYAGYLEDAQGFEVELVAQQ